uniref:Secreted protein n=1 Tax=Plectus sambesii TaxID=2011161 RepID=A0A914UP59_9BILA
MPGQTAVHSFEGVRVGRTAVSPSLCLIATLSLLVAARHSGVNRPSFATPIGHSSKYHSRATTMFIAQWDTGVVVQGGSERLAEKLLTERVGFERITLASTLVTTLRFPLFHRAQRSLPRSRHAFHSNYQVELTRRRSSFRAPTNYRAGNCVVFIPRDVYSRAKASPRFSVYIGQCVVAVLFEGPG